MESWWLMDSKILSVIIKNIKLIQKLPTSPLYAISIRHLAEKHNTPQTTMYRRIKPLLEWDNIGKRQTIGPNTETFLYLKKYFSILFKNGETRIILDNQTEYGEEIENMSCVSDKLWHGFASNAIMKIPLMPHNAENAVHITQKLSKHEKTGFPKIYKVL